MNYTIFSPLAVVCAITTLYAAPTNLTKGAVADIYDEFLAEDVAVDSLIIKSNKEMEAESLTAAQGEGAADNTNSIERPLADPMLLSDDNSVKAPCCEQEENSSFLSIGGTYAYTHFKPQDNPSFNGSLVGIQALYEYRPSNKIYGGLKLSWRQGETDSSNASRFLVDVTAEERIGYTMSAEENKWLLTLFTGLGYRFLGHHLKQDGNSMRFNYSEFYAPVGVFTDYNITPCFSMGIHATWMPQIFPTVAIKPLKGSRFSTTYQLGNILLEAPITFFGGKNKQFFLTVSPTFQYWQNGHTTAKTSTGEALGIPGNTYFFWGADLSLGYAF